MSTLCFSKQISDLQPFSTRIYEKSIVSHSLGDSPFPDGLSKDTQGRVAALLLIWECPLIPSAGSRTWFVLLRPVVSIVCDIARGLSSCHANYRTLPPLPSLPLRTSAQSLPSKVITSSVLHSPRESTAYPPFPILGPLSPPTKLSCFLSSTLTFTLRFSFPIFFSSHTMEPNGFSKYWIVLN